MKRRSNKSITSQGSGTDAEESHSLTSDAEDDNQENGDDSSVDLEPKQKKRKSRGKRDVTHEKVKTNVDQCQNRGGHPSVKSIQSKKRISRGRKTKESDPEDEERNDKDVSENDNEENETPKKQTEKKKSLRGRKSKNNSAETENSDNKNEEEGDSGMNDEDAEYEMVMCWAPECKHCSESETCKFFKFPKEPELRNKWMKLIGLDKEVIPHARLCSCHFEDEKIKDLPTLFANDGNEQLQFYSYEKEKRPIATCSVTSVQSVERVSLEETENQISDLATPSTSRASLEKEQFFLKQRIAELKIKSATQAFSFKDIENDKLCKLYTGLPSKSVFFALYKLLGDIPINYYLGWNVEEIEKIDQLLMCLMKLRQNYPRADLAYRFGVSQDTVTNIIITWIYVLHEILFEQFNPSKLYKEKNKTCLPRLICTYTTCMVELDFNEMAIKDICASMTAKKATFIRSKHKNTWKVLIGVASNGVLTYVSSLYQETVSDKKIVQHCGVLENLEEGDLILADERFLTKDLLPAAANPTFPPTETISRVRIIVKKVIQRMNTFKIINLIPGFLLEHAVEIVQVIGTLTNLYPLIEDIVNESSSESE